MRNSCDEECGVDPVDQVLRIIQILFDKKVKVFTKQPVNLKAASVLDSSGIEYHSLLDLVQRLF